MGKKRQAGRPMEDRQDWTRSHSTSPIVLGADFPFYLCSLLLDLLGPAVGASKRGAMTGASLQLVKIISIFGSPFS